MRAWVAAAVCGLLGLAGLAGCAGGAFAPGSAASQTASGGGAQSSGATLTGKVRGGQQPIVGAHVYLLAANTTGYGGNGMAASASNASVSLLTSGTGTTLDTSGGATSGDYYVTTDGAGSWTITGDYTCTAGQQVYLYALGGDPGAGPNAAAGLLAALGTCPSGGSFLSGSNPISYVVINEVSTVATAYAFAGFATDATHVSSSGTALAQTGIANAFANVANLETLSTGAALAATPAGNGTVPQSEIYTLANILASCVNSNGSGSTACTTLFADTTADGKVTGAQPTDTATAAINIAHNPGANVANLYALAGGTPPFGGGLSAAPNDWTVQITFTAYNSLLEPVGIAIDASGNAWVANAGAASVTELSSTGANLSGPYGYGRGTGLLREPAGIAVDNSGNVWVADFSGGPAFGRVAELSGSSGTFLSGTGYTISGVNPNAITIDGTGNVWVTGFGEFSSSGSELAVATGTEVGIGTFGIAIDGSGNLWGATGASTGIYGIVKVSSTGSYLSPSGSYDSGGLNEAEGVAIDSAGNVWVTNRGGKSITKFSNSGAILSGANGFTGGGIDLPTAIAIDGAGNAWISNVSGFAGVTEVSGTGSILSGVNGYAYNNNGNLFGGDIAVDGSGDVWLTAGYNSYNGVVAEIIGVATPVITPIAAGLPATPTTDGSSKLGTRP